MCSRYWSNSITLIVFFCPQIYPASTRPVDGSPVPFQDIVIQDMSGKTTLSLWNEMVDSFEVGQVLKLTKCRVKIFNEEKKLSSTKGSQCEVRVQL